MYTQEDPVRRPLDTMSLLVNVLNQDPGRPVPWLLVELLDSENHPVPDGQPGEICVQGPIVMDSLRERDACRGRRAAREPAGAAAHAPASAGLTGGRTAPVTLQPRRGHRPCAARPLLDIAASYSRDRTRRLKILESQ